MEQPEKDAITAEAATLAVPFEGWSATPYQDPVGVWTIGEGSTRDGFGYPVGPATPAITLAEGTLLMQRDMTDALAEVFRDVTIKLTDDEAAAIVDFIYNLGPRAFRGSTLLRELNAGDFAGAALEFDKWDHAGGRVLAGLLRRREDERVLFLKT